MMSLYVLRDRRLDHVSQERIKCLRKICIFALLSNPRRCVECTKEKLFGEFVDPTSDGFKYFISFTPDFLQLYFSDS